MRYESGWRNGLIFHEGRWYLLRDEGFVWKKNDRMSGKVRNVKKETRKEKRETKERRRK